MMSVTGVSGQNITITCSFKNKYDNIKYFCKDPCRNDDVLISSSGDKVKWDTNKYSIRDDKSRFHVTIFHLKKEDSGTYKCGVEVILWRHPLQTVIITVKEAMKPEKEPTSLPEQVHPKTSSSLKPLFIGVSLGVTVLVLAVIITIYIGYICTSSAQRQDSSNFIAPSSPIPPDCLSHHSTISHNSCVPAQPTDGTYFISLGATDESAIYCNMRRVVM
nr:CMRF35-like molecule 6 [Nerophis lumbriciformis]